MSLLKLEPPVHGEHKAYSGIGWVRFKRNLSLKFVEMKMRAQSFLKEKVDKKGEMRQLSFCTNLGNNFECINKIFPRKN